MALNFSGSGAYPNRDNGIDFTSSEGTFTIGDVTLDKVFGLAPDGKNAEAVFNANRSVIYDAAERAHSKRRRIVRAEDFENADRYTID